VSVPLPSALGPLLLECQAAFTRPSFESFVVLVTGWIACLGRHTIARVLQAAGPAGRRKHHAAFYRFLARARWVPDRLSELLVRLLLPLLPPEILVIVDDTLCHKSGPQLFGAGMHVDIPRSRYAGRRVAFSFGHDWVVLALWIPRPWAPSRGWAVPVLWRLYRPKRRCPPAAYRKRTDLAAELLGVVLEWLPAGRRVHLVSDAEYACRTVLRALPAHVDFTGPIVPDAALYAPPAPRRGPGRPRRKGRRLRTPTALAADGRTPWQAVTADLYGRVVPLLIKTQVAWWYTVTGVRPVRVIVTRDPAGRWRDRAYVTTATAAAVPAILSTFARRWSLEAAFRDAKQHLGLEDPQNGWWRRRAGRRRPLRRAGPHPRGRRGEPAVLRTVPLIWTVYALVLRWYLHAGQPTADVAAVRQAAPWYRHKHTPAFTDMLASARRAVWTARLSTHPVLARLYRKIPDLLPPWLLVA